MIAPGVLTPNLENATEKSFFGIGFGSRVPIDVLAIYLISVYVQDFSLLVLDEFLKINGQDPDSINFGKDTLFQSFEEFNRIYTLHPEVILASSFMNTTKYQERLQKLKLEIKENRLEYLTSQIVPEYKRLNTTAREYPMHEFACVQHLLQEGFTQKIGPNTERRYDTIMRDLKFPVRFAYMLDAFALATPFSDKVVPYIPTSRGPNNGQRLYVDDNIKRVKTVLRGSCPDALKYMAKVASVSGAVLGQKFLAPEEIDLMFGRKLKKETEKLVLDNIYAPLREVRI
jgi:hypothetical protein